MPPLPPPTFTPSASCCLKCSAGSSPLPPNPIRQWRSNICTRHHHLVTAYNPAIPSQLAQIVNKLLAKEPAGRYRTAGQLGRILSTYRQRSQEETGPVYPPMAATAQQAPAVPVAEQKTEVFQRLPQPDRSESVTRPPMRPLPKPANPVTVSVSSQVKTAAEMDWTAVSLGIFALVALLGLIPLWFLVFRAWVG